MHQQLFVCIPLPVGESGGLVGIVRVFVPEISRLVLVGEEIAEELTKLQAEVPADSAESVHETIIRELGKSADELYAEFSNASFFRPEPERNFIVTYRLDF